MTDICFMDTETLGLHPDAPIWEFAAIRRDADGDEKEFHCFIDHYPLPWFTSLPEPFQQDYQERFKPQDAITRWEAANLVIEATKDAHIIGAVPSFDTLRLSKLIDGAHPHNWGTKDPWHYHLIDVENVIVGFLAGGNQIILPPWSSDELSTAVGVDPEQFDRHTAMGDVKWVRAQWDAVMGALI